MIEIIMDEGIRKTSYAGVVRTREELIAYIRGNGVINERIGYCLPLSQLGDITAFIESIQRELDNKQIKRAR